MTKDSTDNRQAALQGILFALAPFLLLPAQLTESNEFEPNAWRACCGAIAAAACAFGAGLLFRLPRAGKILLAAALAALTASALPILPKNPFAALFFGVLVAGGLFHLTTGRISLMKSLSLEAARWRAQCSLGTLLAATTLSPLLPPLFHSARLCFALCGSIALILTALWGVRQPSFRFRATATALPLLLVATLWILFCFGSIGIFLFLIGLSGTPLLSFLRNTRVPGERWWGTFLLHPARNLFLTFLALISAGTLLLRTNAATTNGIAIVDAAFTAVSGVCVTGLTVIDVGSTLTGVGQLFLLILIQLGGLGIMSAITLALHAFGRLSLNQEKLMHSMIESDERRDLFHSLLLILKFTFATELIGATILFLCFLHDGETPLQAAWFGVFTAVSAFCNAGFFPNAENLIAFADHPVLLHTVALLIILGGMAPPAALAWPRWLTGRPVPLPTRLVLGTTLFLLLFGAGALLVFEWNGILGELSIADKFTHAWFQSATLRTAGFQSVPLETTGAAAIIVMIILMFIGGSPGGTAGGVKTTTIAVLALSFRAATTGQDSIVVRERRIHETIVIQATTIVSASFLILLLTVMALIATQEISARDLVFEATSALATVGLTVGATPGLDEIGKLIVMIAMFIGRIGPLTFFLLLRERSGVREPIRPDARIMLG